MFARQIVIWIDNDYDFHVKLCNTEKELKEIYSYINNKQFFSANFLFDKYSSIEAFKNV